MRLFAPHQKNEITTWIACLVLLMTMGAVHAVPCSQGSVSGSVSCQDGTANNDFLTNPLEVNVETFFGFNDWVFLQKQNTPGILETGIDVGLVVAPTTGTQTGTWEFGNAVWPNYEDVMIVLKTGNNQPVFFSGYLLDNVLMPTAGTWDTGDKDLSHLTLYARGAASGPEPTTAALLLLGLIGAGLSRKRASV